MRRILPVISLFVLMGCQDKVICPAFQSTYILDDSTRNAYYSYVWQLDEVTRTQFLAQSLNSVADSLTSDSLNTETALPKTDYYAYAGEKVVPWRVRGRTKYGIVKYEPYWLKKYRMRTAPMENVYGPKKEDKPDVNYVATSFSDSLATDSLSVASADSLVSFEVAKVEEDEGPKYRYGFDPTDNYNVEQEYYIKHFGQQLIDERPKREPIQLQTVDSLSIASEPDSLQRRGLKGLFKKRKNQADSTTTAPVVEDSDDE